MNLYDSFVAENNIEGDPVTSFRHVDDMDISSMNTEEELNIRSENIARESTRLP